MVNMNNRGVVTQSVEQMVMLQSLFERYRQVAPQEAIDIMDNLEAYFGTFGRTSAEVETTLLLADTTKLQEFVNKLFDARVDLLAIMENESKSRTVPE